MRLYVLTLAAVLLATILFTVPMRAEGTTVDAPVAVNMHIGGRWTGAKLRCQKEVGKLVRCGTPAPFEITFADDGTGSTPDENLPKDFSWRWLSGNEIGIQPKAGREETKLFAVEHEGETILTFQAYVYLPPDDSAEPVEMRYIHYIFDVNRDE